MEKNQLPCWAVLSIIAGLILTGVFIWKFPTSSGEWAAWVQAFGTITAVASAFFVGRQSAERARNIQIESELRERRRVETGHKDVVLNLVSQVESVAKVMIKNDALTFLAAWGSFLKPTTDACLAALDSLPMHDLGSSERIQIAFAIREEAQDFFGKISNLPRTASIATIYDNFRTSELPPLNSALKELITDFEAAYKPQ